MSKAIWKFPLSNGRKFTISMPKDAKIITTQIQFTEGFIWAIVDTESTKEDRHFVNIMTGEPFTLSKTHTYIGTYQLESGYLVVHVFEIK